MSDTGRKFLLDALDLVATRFSARDVEIAPLAVGSATSRDDTSEFLSELATRHALACSHALRPIVKSIELGLSSTATLVREESKGAIRGRLDLPKYIARRTARSGGLPTYPIIVRHNTPSTPENRLVASVLAKVTRQLGWPGFPSSSAEQLAAAGLYSWARGRLRCWPWSVIPKHRITSPLREAARHRVRKQQTGHDAAYSKFLEWHQDWDVDPNRIGADKIESIVGGLLAFPASEHFWDKVFEVWCLKEIGHALARNGCEKLFGPLRLEERVRQPLYKFNSPKGPIEVWFQRQLPLGKGRWAYSDGAPLVGIPDITVVIGGRPYLVDAKFKEAGIESRAEDIYKMLGYAENFRHAFGHGFSGLLLFPGEMQSTRSLNGPDASKLILMTARSKNNSDFRRALDEVVHSWLEGSGS